MTTPLTGQVAVVTGGSQGLGRAIAELLGRAGATIVIGALPGDGVDTAVAELTAAGINATGCDFDVSNLADVERLAELALDHGGLDIWINNAGASGVYGPATELDPATFDRIVDVNIRGVFHGTRTAARIMQRRGGGHIVNVWGKGFDRPVPLQAGYASSKAWNAMFTRTLRRELQGTGVQLHGFDPGLVRTEMLSHVRVAEGYAEKVKALPIVVGLWGRSPAEAARPVLGLVTGRRRDHKALALPRALTKAARSVISGNLAKERRMEMTVEVVSSQPTSPSQS